MKLDKIIADLFREKSLITVIVKNRLSYVYINGWQIATFMVKDSASCATQPSGCAVYLHLSFSYMREASYRTYRIYDLCDPNSIDLIESEFNEYFNKVASKFGFTLNC